MKLSLDLCHTLSAVEIDQRPLARHLLLLNAKHSRSSFLKRVCGLLWIKGRDEFYVKA